MRSNAKKIFDKITKQLKQAAEDAPLLMGEAGTRLFVSSFAKQGYGDGTTIEKWRARKKTTKKNKGKKILIGTGRLRKAVNSSLRTYNKRRIVWTVYLPYAEVHNKGLRAGRGKGFIMPKRKFMGGGYILKRILIKKYELTFKQAMHR